MRPFRGVLLISDKFVRSLNAPHDYINHADFKSQSPMGRVQNWWCLRSSLSAISASVLRDLDDLRLWACRTFIKTLKRRELGEPPQRAQRKRGINQARHYRPNNKRLRC